MLYDYVAQRSDEIQLNAGQLVQVLDTSEQDWWKVCTFKPSSGSPLSSSPGNSAQASSSLSNGHQQQQSVGYFPSSYLAPIYANERPLQVAQTIQVSNGEICDKLLRGQVSSLRSVGRWAFQAAPPFRQAQIVDFRLIRTGQLLRSNRPHSDHHAHSACSARKSR